MMLDHITQHFTWQEAACHDGTPVPMECRESAVALATLLERVRGVLGGPLVPVSWYRTKAWNTRVGGALASQHMTGGAADVRPADLLDLGALIQCVDHMLARGVIPELGGFGTYPGWVHLDVRPRHGARVARWEGVGVGSEVA